MSYETDSRVILSLQIFAFSRCKFDNFTKYPYLCSLKTGFY